MTAVFAQFVTPFEIADLSTLHYHPVAYVRLPRDAAYKSSSPERPGRGWLVVRHKSGNEIFRSDINLFMDGGLGVITEDAQQLTDVLLKSSVKMMDDKRAIEVFGAILQRLEGMQSPWAKMNWSAASNGVECYHENALGKRTKERFVVDLRLERVRY